MAIENEQYEMIMMETMERTEKTISVLNSEYLTIRAGRANPHILDKVLVDYYGTPSPINQVGNISVSEGRCLVIAPWDASMLKVIEKQLLADNIGITPSNDGKVIRLVFPVLTEERRKELVKQTKKIAEEVKVSARNERRNALDNIKALKKDNLITEDMEKASGVEIQKILDEYIAKIDKIASDKEKEVMEV